nr:MAK10-like protein [Tanacetum cinerariifolium]
MVYRSWRRRQDFNLTPSWFQGDSVTSFYDGVKVADIENPKKIRRADGVRIYKRHRQSCGPIYTTLIFKVWCEKKSYGNRNIHRTLGDYSRPSHEGYQNTIELPGENNVVPLRSDTIRLPCKSRPRRTIDQSAGGKLRDKKSEESWALIEDLALYDNESCNDPRDFTKPVKVISLPHDVPNSSDRGLIELENQVQCLMEAHLVSSRIVRNAYAHIEKLKLSEDFYVIDMEKDPTCPLLVGRGFLETASAVINRKKAKIAVREGITRSIFGVKEINLGVEDVPYLTTLGKRESNKPRPSTDGIGARRPYYVKKDFMNHHLPGECEIARDTELNPFKDVLVFRKMVEFPRTIPINFEGNMWEPKELIENKIDWNKPPKHGDGAWHIKIELIDPDGEKFNKTFQSIPITRKLSEKENPSKIIDLEHFHDS